MKNLDLKNYGVATMSTREMKTTNGGNPAIGWFWPLAVAAAVHEIVSDWEHFKDGLMDAIN